MASRKRTIAISLVVAAIMMTAIAIAALRSTRTIPTSGTVYAFKVQVYTDETNNIEKETIPFTNVNPGGTDTEDVYVKNDAGDLPMRVSITTGDCDAHVGGLPTHNISDVGISITWNVTDYTLNKGQGVWARLTLTVLDNAETQKGVTFDVPINFIGDNP